MFERFAALNNIWLTLKCGYVSLLSLVPCAVCCALAMFTFCDLVCIYYLLGFKNRWITHISDEIRNELYYKKLINAEKPKNESQKKKI